MWCLHLIYYSTSWGMVKAGTIICSVSVPGSYLHNVYWPALTIATRKWFFIECKTYHHNKNDDVYSYHILCHHHDDVKHIPTHEYVLNWFVAYNAIRCIYASEFPHKNKRAKIQLGSLIHPKSIITITIMTTIAAAVS